MRSNVGRNRGGGGRGRGLRGDQSKGVFYKLLKDEKASLRSKDGVRRFIIGMESFAEKSELLGLLDDNRYQGLVSFSHRYSVDAMVSIESSR